jgi:hypothetical protein
MDRVDDEPVLAGAVAAGFTRSTVGGIDRRRAHHRGEVLAASLLPRLLSVSKVMSSAACGFANNAAGFANVSRAIALCLRSRKRQNGRDLFDA